MEQKEEDIIQEDIPYRVAAEVHGDPFEHGYHLCGGSAMKTIVFWNRVMIFDGISLPKISNHIIECLIGIMM